MVVGMVVLEYYLPFIVYVYTKWKMEREKDITNAGVSAEAI